MTPSGPGEPEVHRITQAPRAHSSDLEARMRRYLVSMLVRTVCVVLVIVVHSPVRWGFAAGAVFLPYIAVIMANAGRGRRDDPPPARAVHRELTGTAPEPAGPVEGIVPDRP